MPGIDFDAELNAEQRAAALAPDGPVLVLAAAGTGKTRTLVYRVAHLVERGVPPDRILLLTFTNRAAREMLERAETLVGPGIGGVWGGTFHHMANRILRRNARALGYRSDYTILDRDDAKALVRDCVRQRGLASKEFPKREVLLSLFSNAANTERPVSKLAEERFDDLDVNIDAVERVHTDYQERKKSMGAMDFDDLLVKCLDLLRQHPELAAGYQERFVHILVDEYQDTNTIQAELVDRLASRHRNLLVVGDDFQSIYGWRGADFRNIMSFPDRYPGTLQFKLETNYRSVPEILNVANACIAGNPLQFQKELRPVRDAYRRPRLLRVRDGSAQAEAVADQIRLLRRAGYKYSEMAILYRAHFHAMETQLALTRANVPYTITSGLRFFEQAHIKDVCSVLRLLENPADELSFGRLLAMLPGVGEKTVMKIWEKLGRSFQASTKSCGDVEKGIRGTARPFWKEITPVLLSYAEGDLAGDGGEVVRRFVDAFYEEHAFKTFDNAESRIDDINEMVTYLARFESVQEFLSDVALLTNVDSEEAGSSDQPEQIPIRLSTVHQAKGLEWAVVIVLWVTDGMFPSARSLAESGDDTEERRLFYVAATRAKDELIFIAPEIRRMRDGGIMPCTTSRFISELPLELLEEKRPMCF